MALRPQKYNWDILEKEFISREEEISITNFLKEKNIPRSNMGGGKTTGWLEKRRAFQKKSLELAKEKILEEEVESVSDIRKRQARLARFMQLKGAAKLRQLDPQTIDESRRLIISGMKEERKAVGMESEGRGGGQSLTQINILGAKTNLDKIVEGLDYEGILELVADLRRHRAKRLGEESTGGGSTEVEEGETV